MCVMNRVDNASLKTSKPWLPLDDCASLSRCCLRVVFEGASLSLDNIEDFAGVTEGNQFQSLPEKKTKIEDTTVALWKTKISRKRTFNCTETTNSYSFQHPPSNFRVFQWILPWNPSTLKSRLENIRLKFGWKFI